MRPRDRPDLPLSSTDGGSIHGTGSLIGFPCGVSLDGQSLLLSSNGGVTAVDSKISPTSIPAAASPGTGTNYSLDGQSFLVDHDDEVSSINSSSIYQGRYQNLKILGPAKPLPERQKRPSVPVRRTKSSRPPAQTPSAGKRPCCLPAWLMGAPLWLKLILVVTGILVLAAIVLVAVAVTFALTNEKETSSDSTKNTDFNHPNNPTADYSTITSAPVTPAPVPVTAPPTSSPAPTTLANTMIATFYATGGRYPQFVRNDLDTLLPHIPSHSFVVHLGDWNSPSVTNCSAESYEAVAQAFRLSSSPVYFIVGDNEYNDCEDELVALERWRRTLIGYETRFWPAPVWTVDRQVAQPENFAFVHKDIVFVGINLVAGSVYDASELGNRTANDLAWIEQSLGRGDATTMVIVMHSAPDNSQNAVFFSQLLDLILTYDSTHFILVYRSGTYDTVVGLVEQYDQIPNLDAIAIRGSVWPPVQIQIDQSGLGRPVVTLNDGQWYNQSLETGQPPQDGGQQQQPPQNNGVAQQP